MSKLLSTALLAFPLYLLAHPSPSDVQELRDLLSQEKRAIEELRSDIDAVKEMKRQALDHLKETRKKHSDEILSLLDEIDSLLVTDEGSLTDFDEEEPHEDLERYRPDTDMPGLFVRGDFLYWKTLEGSLDYAIQDQPVTNGERGAIGKYESAKFSLDPGFRLAAGIRFPPDNWETELSWTRFYNQGRRKTIAPIASSSFALVGTFHQTTGARLQAAKSNIDLKLNTADLSLAKRFYPFDKVLGKLFTSLSGAWLDQDWSIDYLSTVNDDFIHQHWNYKGGGVRIGLSLDWLLGWGFGIATKFSGAGFVGSYKNDFKYTEETSLGAINTLSDSHFQDTRFVFNLQYFLGLDWGWTFKNEWNLNFTLGYEIQPWFNLQEVNRATFSTSYLGRDSHISQGLLACEGLTFSAELSF